MSAVRNHTAFSVRVDDEHDRSVISVEGELDSFTAGELREAFARALGPPGVIIDIRDVPFLDSAGLGALLGGVRRVRDSGGRAAVCCTTSSVRRLLAMTGFDRAVPITSTPAEAEEVISATPVAGSER